MGRSSPKSAVRRCPNASDSVGQAATQADGLTIESYEDAIRATCQRLRGAKAVASALRGDLTADAAGRWLDDCLNPDKRDKLSLSQLAKIRQMARDAGVHILAEFEMRGAGYAAPVPVRREEEVLAVSTQIDELVARLERLKAGGWPP